MKRLVTARKWINRIVGIIMILFVLGLSVFFAWLNSATGLRWLARSLTTATGGLVEFTGLSGRIPFHLNAEQMILRDSNHAEWLVARDIKARSHLRALLQLEFAVGKINAGLVEWRLFPHYHVKAHGNEGSTSDAYVRILPDPLKALRLDSAFIDDFIISTNIIGYEFRGALRGKARWHGEDDVYAEVTGPVLAAGAVSAVLDVIFKFENGQLIFPRLDARSASNPDWFRGSAAYTIRNRALASTGELSVADTSLYYPFHRLPLTGPAELQLTAAHERKGQPWAFIFHMASEGLAFSSFTNAGMKINGRINLRHDATEYELDYLASSAAVPDWNFQQVAIRSIGTNTGFGINLNAAGQYKNGDSFTLKSRHQITGNLDAATWDIVTPSAEGAWNNRPLAIAQTATISFSSNNAHVSLPALEVAGGTGSAMLSLSGQVLQEARMNLSDISCEELAGLFHLENEFWQGTTRIDASIVASHLTGQPEANASVQIRDIVSRHPLMRPFRGSSISITGRLDQTNINASATFNHPLIEQFEMTAAGRTARSDGAVPVTVDLDHGFEARIQLRGELSPISRKIIDTPASLGGTIELDLKASHLPLQPVFDGYFKLQNGEFRHITTGTYLDQINVGLSGKDNALAIDYATANDGGSGKLEAKGLVTFGDHWTPTWDSELDLDRISLFRLIKSDLPLTGSIQSKGDPEWASVKGQVWLEPSAFLIPRRLPPAIRELTVREINHPDPARNSPLDLPARPEHANTTETNSRPFDFDLTIQTRKEFEVKGRGLQSDWRGVVHLGGNSRNPSLIGTNAIKKGYAMLLGRRFNIDRGQIIFTGEIPPDPRLNIEASTRIGDVLVRLIVSGTTDRPRLTLASDPMMTDNEIMSMILFGKSTETMSPWQAIALANGLRVLGGQGGDLVEILDAGQNVLQLDQIDVKQDESGEGFSSLSVGKYIGSRLYIEGEKGMGGSEDKFMVSYELSRRLVLETEASPRIREGIRLLWRREY